MVDGMMGYIDTKGLELASKGTSQILQMASHIYDSIRGSYEILDKEITINCPDLLQKYSILFKAKGGVGKIASKKIRFPLGKPTYVNLRPLRSLQDLSEAVNINNEGFEISTKGMEKHDEFHLEVNYNIKDIRFIDSLVHKNRAREVPKDKENEYWMHAELKHPKVLKSNYGKIDLKDIDFSVDVGISSDIKMHIPNSFKYELQSAANLLAERDLRKKSVLGAIHIRSMKQRDKKENVVKLIGELQRLFERKNFHKYVQVEKDFYYHDCERGVSLHEGTPFPTWPKSMKVTSRTSLGLEKYASDGILYYKKRDFLDEVSKILGI